MDKKSLLLSIYEVGATHWVEAMKELTGVEEIKIDRHQARDIIGAFINRNISIVDRIHPLTTISDRQVYKLIKQLQAAAQTGKVDIDDYPISVF